MKLTIVTGSRDWENRTAIWSALDQEEPDIVMHGSCEALPKAQLERSASASGATRTMRGADLFADEWCRKFGVMLVTVPALFQSKFGTRAGPLRNTFMAKLAESLLAGWPNPEHEVVVLCAPRPGSKGTIDMMAKAKARGWRLRLVEGADG